MRLGILNDLHIALNGEFSHGVDTCQNTLDVLAAMKTERLDRIYLLGDICLQDPSIETYEWLMPHLHEVGVPFCIVPGNHDSVSLIKAAAGVDATFDEYQRDILDDHTILCLDSSKSQLNNAQLEWLHQQLNAGSGPVVLFIHHPPTTLAVPYMDARHSLSGREDLMRICLKSGRRMMVFCGHYHVDKVVIEDNVTIFSTPSCYCQIASHTDEFLVDHYRIGYRIIELSHRSLTTEVRYLTGNKVLQMS
ncbi:MAG: metallophosphoesterase family protein [Saprospiraceae bacterium]|nr:metallophosphoesterase family protein [Saprospiraceae bacterium]